FDRQRDDSLPDSIQVGRDFDGLFFLLAFFTLFAFLTLVTSLRFIPRFVLVGFFAFVSACWIFFFFSRFSFVALRLHWRVIAYLEYRLVHASEDLTLKPAIAQHTWG